MSYRRFIKPAACSLGEPVSKVELSAAPLSSNQLHHSLKVTLCSTWGELSKVGASVRWPVRTRVSERALCSVLPLPATRTRCLCHMEGVSPFRSMGKAQNFNPTMCCPGKQPTDLCWLCKLLSSHQSRFGSCFFPCNRLWMPTINKSPLPAQISGLRVAWHSYFICVSVVCCLSGYCFTKQEMSCERYSLG